MKSIFPKAEETVILDVLANNDNNIQKTSDILKEMGYEKRDVFKVLQQQAEEKAKAEEEELIQIQSAEEMARKVLTPEDKIKGTFPLTFLLVKYILFAYFAVKKTIETKYENVPEKVIAMALESVDYDENKARQILDIMVQEEQEKNKLKPEEV